MLNWIKENNYPMTEVIEKAKAIQEEHKKLFGESMPILDTTIPENKEKGLENPFNYKYSQVVRAHCCLYKQDDDLSGVDNACCRKSHKQI